MEEFKRLIKMEEFKRLSFKKQFDFIYENIDIVDVVGAYVPNLRPAGRALKGFCPFHRDDEEEFVVDRFKQICHCFGCGFGGGKLDVIMRLSKLTAKEAVNFLYDDFYTMNGNDLFVRRYSPATDGQFNPNADFLRDRLKIRVSEIISSRKEEPLVVSLNEA